jgi:glycosyltransferase involved in cell wall biosynthesis
MGSSIPKISVLLAVYNGLPYIKDAVVSIQQQTFDNWELILVDDGSTDGTGEYILSMAEKDPRIRYIKSETNLGHSPALNLGLAACQGEWVARMDGDDIAMPNRLERQLYYVQTHADLLATGCLAYYIGPDGKRFGGKTYHDLIAPDVFQRYMDTNEAIGILHPGAFIRRDILVKLGGYRPQFDPTNDIDLWNRISELGMILVQPEYLMEYRIHGNSIVAKGFWKARMKYEWIRACMRARRSGNPEPTEEEFLSLWKNVSISHKFNRWRKMKAKYLYRKAGFEFIRHHYIQAAINFGLSSVLQPGYTLFRVKNQILPQGLQTRMHKE